MKTKLLWLTLLFPALAYASDDCSKILVEESQLLNFRAMPQKINFLFPNLQIASVTDPTYSTGATLFYFPDGARANFDARGGSVAAVETTLLEEGSYSNVIDGIVFAGGSTMGLAVTDGVRATLFDARKGNKNLFDFIPSIPGAVVYDFGGRVAPHNHPHVYPTAAMGQLLLQSKKPGEFLLGRAGAGISTTFNKIGERRWGGQGIGLRQKGNLKVMAFVILNAMGDVKLPNGQSIVNELQPIRKGGYKNLSSPLVDFDSPSYEKPENTTLTLIITNARLDRSALKRLAVMTHTGMAAMIRPFHTPGDGDIQYAVSAGNETVTEEEYYELTALASEAMADAIYNGIRAANPAK